jgi:hypothetical protein
MILGAVLVFFGALMLIDDFPIWYEFKKYFWPIVLIAIGAFLILRQRDKQQENNSTVYPTTPPPPVPTEPTAPDPIVPEPIHSLIRLLRQVQPLPRISRKIPKVRNLMMKTTIR